MEGKELKKARYSTLRIGGERGGGGGSAPFLSRSGRPPRAPNGRREEPYNRGLTTLSVHREGDQAFLFLCGALRGKARGGEPCAALAFAPPHPLSCSSSTTTFPFFTLAFSYEGGCLSCSRKRRGEGRGESPGSKTEKEPRQGKAGSSSLEEEEEGAFWLLLFSRFSFPSSLCTLSLTLPVRLEASTAACRGRRRRRGTTCERHFPALLRF